MVLIVKARVVHVLTMRHVMLSPVVVLVGAILATQGINVIQVVLFKIV